MLEELLKLAHRHFCLTKNSAKRSRGEIAPMHGDRQIFRTLTMPEPQVTSGPPYFVPSSLPEGAQQMLRRHPWQALPAWTRAFDIPRWLARLAGALAITHCRVCLAMNRAIQR
jgi:hypothetical protein